MTTTQDIAAYLTETFGMIVEVNNAASLDWTDGHHCSGRVTLRNDGTLCEDVDGETHEHADYQEFKDAWEQGMDD